MGRSTPVTPVRPFTPQRHVVAKRIGCPPAPGCPALRAYYRRLCSRTDKLGMLMVPT